MTEALTRRHGLEPFLQGLSRHVEGRASVQVRILGDLGHINLRGPQHRIGFMEAAENALGQSLPVEPNTISVGDHRVHWLGPDEWLLVTGAEMQPELLARMQADLAGRHASVNDISGGQIALRVAGDSARELLSKGCTLDFHPDVFTVGTCAQSGLAKASVLFGCVDDRPTFDIVVRRSFSDYLAQWMHCAGAEYGIEFR